MASSAETAPSTERAASTELLAVEAVGKRFFGAMALDGISLRIRPAEIHGLMGENGAGKSTLLKIISGILRPDSGQIRWDGAPVEILNARVAGALGIAMIHQELSLVPELTVAENVFIRREPVRFGGLIDWAKLAQATREILDRIGLKLNPQTKIRELSMAEQQMVEIARALSMNARLLIMDEPTSSLSEREANILLDLMRRLRDSGVAVLFVTHRMEEAMSVCDRFTVLRDGALAGTCEAADVTSARLISLMAGREEGGLYRRPRASTTPGPVRLSVDGMRTQRAGGRRGARVSGVSLSVRAGEILGIAGLVGAGRSELVQAIFGADRSASGRVEIDGKRVEIRNPRDAMRLGIALLPEDRKHQSLFGNLGIRANFSIAALDRFSHLTWMLKKAEAGALERFRTMLRIRMRSAEQPARTLSGGNQQKVLLARWLVRKPRILIVDEPTRGIDVNAKSEVHAELDRLAREGVAIIVVSSELAELIAVADRIITMREGIVTGEIQSSEATNERLMAMMTIGSS